MARRSEPTRDAESGSSKSEDKRKRRIQIRITDAETGAERGAFEYVAADIEDGGFSCCCSCTNPWWLFNVD
jgi:hypothetical protein